MWYKGSGILVLSLLLLKPLRAEDDGELVFVHLLYRHGDRTPLDPYPNDPYKNRSYWPTDFGQLINKGKILHFQLGQWFRKRYEGFLPDIYSMDDIYVRSTDVDRTLMSAQVNLAGLYAPRSTDVWNPNLMWQPIPIHTLPQTEDSVLSAQKKCPRYDLEFRKVLNSAEIHKINKKIKPMMEYVSNNTGKTVDSFQELGYIYNTLFIESQFGFKLPEWTEKVYPDKMKPYVELGFSLPCYTKQLQRLKVGLLINEIMTRLVDKTKDALEPDRKMWVYSAHDTTVANVLMGFGAFQPHNPPYASTIIIELRVVNGTEYFVNTYYKNGTDPRPISILGCDYSCPLDKLLELLDPVMVTMEEWQVECESFSGPVVSTIAATAVISCGLLLIILLVSLCVGAVFSRKRTRTQLYQPLANEIN